MVTEPDGHISIRPERGTRPANRRQLITTAAADLFYRKGYANVGVGDVADAVAIGPSALYRHFRGKQDLLATVVGEAMKRIDDVLIAADADQSIDIAATLAATVLEHRDAGMLWRRDARRLPADSRAEIRTVAKRSGERLAALIRTRRPAVGVDEADLLGWCAFAAANSVSFHQLSLPEPEFIALLRELITSVIEAPVPVPAPRVVRTDTAGPLTTHSRREAILNEATVLFAENGFTGVSMEDIGSAVGIAGPSIYNHFPSKANILAAAMIRGDEWLRMGMSRAFARATSADDGLHRLLRSYCSFVFDHPHLVQVLVSEAGHLPDAERERTRATQHAYIAEWVHLLRQVHPQCDPVYARIRVQAAQTMMNDIALTPHLRTYPAIESVLVIIGAELLAPSAHRVTPTA